MNGVSEAEVVLTESEKIEKWRHDVLVKAGYDDFSAAELAPLTHVDLTEAVNLVKQKGCSVELAVQILR